MRVLSTSELLDVWERGLVQQPAAWALTVLAVASPDTPLEVLEGLSVGQRDAYLLAVRERTFGPRLTSLAVCPACGEHLELDFDVGDVRVAPASGALPEPEESGQEAAILSLTLAGYDVRFRLPNSLDLAMVAGREDADAARHLLLERCLLTVHPVHGGPSASQLPAEVADAVVARMAEADPQADVQLALACPACGHEWRTTFDIVSFFWHEIDAWAHRTLYDVHRLARAYGWAEADILAMNAWRRQIYLDMLNG
jgi:hypothetical protein